MLVSVATQSRVTPLSNTMSRKQACIHTFRVSEALYFGLLSNLHFVR